MAVTRGTTVNVDWTLNESASTTSLTCTLPSAMASGKVLVAHVIGSTSSLGLPGTGSWQWAAGTPLGTNNEVLTGLAFTTDPAAGLTFTQATAGRMTVILTVYSGENAVTVMDVTPTTGNVTTQSMTLTGITTVTDGDMLISGCGINASTITTITQPTSWSLVARNTSGTGKGGAYADFSQTSQGATGNQVWTNDASAGLRQAGYLAAVRAATAGSLPAATSVVPQQPPPTGVAPVVVTPAIGPPQVVRLPQITVARHVKQPPAPFPVAVNPPYLPAEARPAPPITVAAQARLPQPPTISVSAAQIPTPTAGILPVSVTVAAEQSRPAAVAPIVLTPPPLPQAPALPAPVLALPPATRPPPVQPLAVTPAPLPQPAAPILVATSSRSPGPLQIVIGAPQFPAPVAGILPPAPTVVVTSTWRPAAPQTVVSQPQLPAVAAILAPAPVLTVPAFTRPGSAPASVPQPRFLGLPVTPAAPILVVPTFTRFRPAPIAVSQPAPAAAPLFTPVLVGVDAATGAGGALDGSAAGVGLDGSGTSGGQLDGGSTGAGLDGSSTYTGQVE